MGGCCFLCAYGQRQQRRTEGNAEGGSYSFLLVLATEPPGEKRTSKQTNKQQSFRSLETCGSFMIRGYLYNLSAVEPDSPRSA